MLGLCSLEVRDVESGDAGVYTVRACNAMGEVASNAKLLVYGKCFIIMQGWPKTGLFLELISLRRLVVERLVVCQKFPNFIEKETTKATSHSV